MTYTILCLSLIHISLTLARWLEQLNTSQNWLNSRINVSVYQAEMPGFFVQRGFQIIISGVNYQQIYRGENHGVENKIKYK